MLMVLTSLSGLEQEKHPDIPPKSQRLQQNVNACLEFCIDSHAGPSCAFTAQTEFDPSRAPVVLGRIPDKSLLTRF